MPVLGTVYGISGFIGFFFLFLSMTISLLPIDLTIPSISLTTTLPLSSTSNVISVTVSYPSGATSSWKVYVPGNRYNTRGLSLEVHCSSKSSPVTLI